MTSLLVGWDAKKSMTRRHWRVYHGASKNLKGRLAAEVAGNETGYILRDVPTGLNVVRVIAVNNAGTEDDWVAAGNSAFKVVSRDTQSPSTLTNSGASQVASAISVAVVFDPPSENEPATEVEVIRGADPSLGQLVAVVPAERGSDTGESGARTTTATVPAMPGRTGDRTVLSIRGRTKSAKHPGSVVTVPMTTVGYPNHDAVTFATIALATLTGIHTPTSNQRWEHGSYGGRLRACPPSSEWLGASTTDGWGLSGTGILAAEPSGAYYMTAATITVSTYDLGAVKDFWLECYDEAQRDPAELPMASLESRLLSAYSGPLEVPFLAGDDRNPDWAFQLIRSDGKPVRPLPMTRWQYRYGDTEPLGDWLEYVPGVHANGRYVQAQMIVHEPMGMNRVLVPYAYCRAWTPHAQAPMSSTPPHNGVLKPVGYAGLAVKENAAPQNIGTAPVTVTLYDTATPSRYVTASVDNGTFVVVYGGIYSVDFASSFSSDSNNFNLECYLWVNAVEQVFEFHRRIQTAGALGAASFNGVVSLATNDVVFVKVEASDDSKSWTPEALSFRISREE